MSQQINLLRAKDRSFGASVSAGSAIVVTMIVLAVYYQLAAAEAGRLHAIATAKADHVAQLKEAAQSRQTLKSKEGDSSALNAEITALRPRAEALSTLLQAVANGSLGSAKGLSPHYRSLSAVSMSDVWVTSINVSQGGTVVTVTGRALRNEDVMQYAQRLNGAFAPHGVRFNSVDMTPEVLTNKTSLATVLFKLS